jgi:fluoroacetyl-CoA thioesterase
VSDDPNPTDPPRRGAATLTVEEGDLASVIAQSPPDAFPPVLATARMIALMELAASRALHDLLAEGEVSVGTALDVAHTAPTPLGATVTAEATVTGREGAAWVFDVVASDGAGEIGRGTHRRAVVESARIVRTAAKRHAP